MDHSLEGLVVKMGREEKEPGAGQGLLLQDMNLEKWVVAGVMTVHLRAHPGLAAPVDCMQRCRQMAEGQQGPPARTAAVSLGAGSALLHELQAKG